MNAISELECNELTLHSPLELLFAQYKQDKEGIERIAGYVADAKQMHYFFTAAKAADRHFQAGAAEVFRLEPAISALNAGYWQKAMLLYEPAIQ